MYGCKSRAGSRGAVKGRAAKGSAVKRALDGAAPAPKSGHPHEEPTGTIEQCLGECACLCEESRLGALAGDPHIGKRRLLRESFRRREEKEIGALLSDDLALHRHHILDALF